MYELAADFGIARQTVSLILKRNGVPMRIQGLREGQRVEVAGLRAPGVVVCAAGRVVHGRPVDGAQLPAARVVAELIGRQTVP